jgi:predicted hydrocarbon binding protein
MAGNVVTKTIFYIVGEAIGRRAYEYSKDDAITSENLADVIDGVLTLRGWGRLLSLNRTETSDEVTYQCTFKDCIVCHKRTAQEPICDVMRGIFAGWLESFLGRKAKSSIETGCRATGNESCMFKTTFSK